MNYAYQKDIEKTARAAMKNVKISTKTAIEMCDHLRYKELSKAKLEVGEILKKKKALPFKKFTNGLGHRKGNLAAGRYPENASVEFLKLLNSVESNASDLNLGSELKIVHLVAHKGNNDFRWGRRQRRHKRKNTHLEIVVKEIVKKSLKKNNSIKTVKETVKEDETSKNVKKPVESKKETIKKPIIAKSAVKEKVEDKK